ncbi:hypothetical protein [Pseudomonas putida]|uniref:hypothetical protein n=1 Tax=Pseudomonas putida TaxID=303 RepID=UPI0015E17793|nr:hypothetical protein [Pseudomonas putida]
MNPTYRQMELRFTVAFPVSSSTVAPERNRERSIGLQVVAWNVGFMERIQPENDMAL